MQSLAQEGMVDMGSAGIARGREARRNEAGSCQPSTRDPGTQLATGQPESSKWGSEECRFLGQVIPREQALFKVCKVTEDLLLFP